MTLAVSTCPRLIALLGEFYPLAKEAAPFQVVTVLPAMMPEPERSLLVHDRDMTSTLTRHHGDELRLDVLERRLHDDRISRHIVLRTVSGDRPVEYGAIRIDLTRLEDPVREEILRCERPLGRILNEHRVGYRSCPGGFFRIRSTPLMDDVLELDGPEWLFGRCNCLSDGQGHAIAEVVEVLPSENVPSISGSARWKSMKRS